MAFNILFGLPCTILQLCTVSLYTDNIRIMEAIPTKEQKALMHVQCVKSADSKKRKLLKWKEKMSVDRNERLFCA